MYKKKDFVSDQEVRWCPGCGDYAILSCMQNALTKTGTKKEDIVCVSGIGCSSRFPYYLDTYGYHTIHGRAPAVATGIKLANPNLDVWVITGDGDGLSIGGNHTLHAMRRNVDLNIILFNNEIYGLTKGQFSPTSDKGVKTKTSPFGSIDNPLIPAQFALGSACTFIARTVDKDPKSITDLMLLSHAHKGTSFLEVLQNCVIFNDKTHDEFTLRQNRAARTVTVEDGKPLIFGAENEKGIVLDRLDLKVVTLGQGFEEKDLLVYDTSSKVLANMLIEAHKKDEENFPLALGVLYQDKESIPYNELMKGQAEQVKKRLPEANMDKLLQSGDTWEIK